MNAPALVSDQYLAGFFDGEGSVCISTHLGPPPMRTRQYVLVVAATQNDPRPLMAFKERFGGKIYSQGKGRRGWQWVASAQRARPMLEGLLPYLLVKRRDAEIGLAFLDISHREKPKTLPTPGRVAQREAYRSELIELHGSASSVTNRKKET